MSEQEFHEARNSIVRVCRRHGRTGPLGEYNPAPTGQESFQDGDSPADFFVVDDQLSHDRDLFVGILSPNVLTINWVLDIEHALLDMRGWAVWLRNLDHEVDAAVMPGVLLIHGDVFKEA